MRDFHAIWGCAGGPLRTVQPHFRIAAGLLVGGACLAMPLQSLPAASLPAGATAAWVALAAMPARMLLQCAAASIVLFFPLLALTPWMSVDAGSTAPMADRIAHAAAIMLRSVCCFFIAAAAIASLSMSDAHRGLARLPVPGPAVALIMQIVNQSMALLEETSRIISVLRLRGAHGVRGVRALFSFPVVWMVRMLFRAERIAAAMSVRGYGIERRAAGEKSRLTIGDFTLVTAASAVFLAAFLLRLREWL